MLNVLLCQLVLYLMTIRPFIIRSYPSRKVGTVEDEAAQNSEYTEPDWPLLLYRALPQVKQSNI